MPNDINYAVVQD